MICWMFIECHNSKEIRRIATEDWIVQQPNIQNISHKFGHRLDRLLMKRIGVPCRIRRHRVHLRRGSSWCGTWPACWSTRPAPSRIHLPSGRSNGGRCGCWPPCASQEGPGWPASPSSKRTRWRPMEWRIRVGPGGWWPSRQRVHHASSGTWWTSGRARSPPRRTPWRTWRSLSGQHRHDRSKQPT